MEKEIFGAINNQPVFIYTLRNMNGIKIRITNYGAIIQSLFVPDKNGKLENGGQYTAAWRKTDGIWRIYSELYVGLYCNGVDC